jgi:superfamily II DNA or RNA helicase
MSHAAMTSGLEWNLKVTSQDLGHILEKFSAEFETYWHSREFLPYDADDPVPFREAIERARKKDDTAPAVFFDLQPHPFQERILEKLALERTSRHCFRNLVIAATGTGKTVIAAFDYQRFCRDNRGQARLLFIAHRQEILAQALFTFRQVLRDANFGEMLAGSHEAVRMEHLFCSIQMMTSRQMWNLVGSSFYDYIVVDEAHHGTAASYRPLFDHFEPKILLGLTATPERMDGGNVAADFHNRFAAEIRLPEALEEKLLCPFHYFGVADPVDISRDHFWRNGRYDDRATLASAGQKGTGVLHFRDIKAYALLITFQKTEKEFSPTTMYADYPISRTLLHWESQSNTALDSPTGQNLVHHEIRGYTILVFARPKKKQNQCTVPFVFLGPARHVSHQKERPIQMVWELRYPMPVEMFEENKRGG